MISTTNKNDLQRPAGAGADCSGSLPCRAFGYVLATLGASTPAVRCVDLTGGVLGLLVPDDVRAVLLSVRGPILVHALDALVAPPNLEDRTCCLCVAGELLAQSGNAETVRTARALVERLAPGLVKRVSGALKSEFEETSWKTSGGMTVPPAELRRRLARELAQWDHKLMNAFVPLSAVSRGVEKGKVRSDSIDQCRAATASCEAQLATVLSSRVWPLTSYPTEARGLVGAWHETLAATAQPAGPDHIECKKWADRLWTAIKKTSDACFVLLNAVRQDATVSGRTA